MKKPLILLMTTAVSLFCSCTHKDLDFTGTADLTVEFDWDAVSEANPSSMSLTAFTGLSQPIQKHFQGSKGGTLMLPVGQHQLIAFNDDNETVSSRGFFFDDYEVFANPTELSTFSRMFVGTRNIPRGSGTEGEPVITEPDEVWTSALSDVSVTGSVGRTVTMPMEPATFTIHFTILNVDNIDFVTDVMATVSGMSGSWWPARHVCSQTACIIPFGLDRSGQGFTGTVRTFGYRATDENGNPLSHLLVVYAEMSDGSKKYYTFNVTDKMNEVASPDGQHVDVEVDIVLSELPFPKPVEGGASFNTDVTSWEEVLIPINM